MPVCAVLGAQWGDEGKGNIVDYLARNADIVARFNGGNNAGHTVINPQGKFHLHLVPAGVFWPGVTSLIGNGVVVDPAGLLDEIRGLKQRGIDLSGRLMVSQRAHLVMPYHSALDRLAEEAKGTHALGTTGMGIGPAYMDKSARIGIRVGDLLDLDSLYPKLERVMAHHNAIITRIYQAEPISLEAVFEKCREWGSTLAAYIGSAEQTVADAISAGKRVLIEGAQGALLDLDYGTYPYVTASNPTIGGACSGLGVLPGQIDSVVGVFKAYSTRLGSGPMTTEILDGTGDLIRESADEFGSTTGRPRRIGWFDGVLARYSSQINGYSSIALTRLDVLDQLDSIRICTDYQIHGKRIDAFPSSAEMLEACQPVYEEIPGWTGTTCGATCLEDLPKGARSYVNRIAELVGQPVDLISTGPERDQTIPVAEVFPD